MVVELQRETGFVLLLIKVLKIFLAKHMTNGFYKVNFLRTKFFNHNLKVNKEKKIIYTKREREREREISKYEKKI